jgi:TolA-binding protein
MRGSGWLGVLLAALVVCPAPARAETSAERLRRLLENSNIKDEDRKRIEKQLRNAEKRRDKKIVDERKKAQKVSLEAVKKAFEKGKKAYDEQRYSVAYLHLSSVAACGLKSAAKMAAEARTKVNQIEGMARSKLNQAELLLLRGEATEAAQAFLEVVQDFPHGDASKRARIRLRAVKTTPGVAASLKYSEGKAHEEAENYGQALKIYDEVVERWPEEIAALRAKVAARKVRQDPEKSAIAREALEFEAERECPTLLNLAMNFLINDDRATARAKLNQVVQDYPGTSYAVRATAALDALAKEQVKSAMALLKADSGDEDGSDAGE